MSRELKFRVWNEAKNKFMPSGFIGISDGKFIDLKNGSIHFDSDDKVIEQFTGLRDKNGKEIYENDLIKAVGKNVVDDTLSVVFKNGAFCLKLGQESEPFFNDDYNIDFTLSHLEIIGNIHENGDLLKNLGGENENR